MKLYNNYFWILTATLLNSCSNGEDTPNQNSEVNKTDTSTVSGNAPNPERTFNVQDLEGKWKEFEYPFRLLHFKDSTVKFTEEGVIEPPRFKSYKILNACSYEVNNIKNARKNDVFLVVSEDSTCEIINLANDTLTLSGFSTNTNSDYHISFGKIK